MKVIVSLLLCMFTLSQVVIAQENKEQVAQTWLTENVQNLKANQSFALNSSRAGLSGETFRYQHTVNGVEVFDSSIAVHVSKKNKVTYHSSTFDESIETINTTPSISENEALQAAITALRIEGVIYQEEVKLYVYNKLDATKLVYRVTTMSEFLIGYWETIVDAQTGAVLSTNDISIYEKEKSAEPQYTGSSKKKAGKRSESVGFSAVANGTAMVFDPDPLTKTLNIYGGNYSDNNDATNADLDAARTAVTLLDIEQTGSDYRLRGPYAEIAELQSPATGLFIQDSPDFDFTRDEQGFEAANCYYHLDKAIRHINEDLGITLVSIYNGGVVRYDPHAFNGADNSSYGGGSLNFGEGGVDDAEDMDVILHELGHGLHDWITNGNLSQVNGLSEGTGDYFANSYKRGLGQWQTSDPSYYYVFGWDGHNPYWPGRVTNYTAMYPGGLTGSIHTDGQIWATVLLEIWEIIGKDKMDTAVLEGLAMTNSSTNQQNAAIAVRQAAIDMDYTCAEIDAFTERFEARGYVLPPYSCTGCSISDIEATNFSACDDNGTNTDPSDDFFTADIVVTFENTPATGTLDLTGDGTASVSVAGLVSPYTFTGVTLPSDGEAIDLTAAFSDDAACLVNESNAGTAPEPCSALGVADIDAVLTISLYPNPVDDTITFLDVTKEYNATVYNLLGQKILEQTIDTNANTLNVSNVATGAYIIKIEGYSDVLKFIKK
ncbi:T9SS type A sorting domain-containing protein [Ulvibacter litoralis]|uniref:Por secretion system C-terminal sorting domain-containing protein n=1 Tax=Ulvibacter litoralis TaxID=227084 RepID=A0A1G7C444_9FLAO|nr:T9SS type A sorting domain-containing protein [Ulvibacter litoralis]SDE34154.1 Por secretion system C-terminal sorting domain-containing protein [Ulvibacter litoralis]